MTFVKVHFGGGKSSYWNMALATQIKGDSEKSTLQIAGNPIVVQGSPDEVIAAIEGGLDLYAPGVKEEK